MNVFEADLKAEALQRTITDVVDKHCPIQLKKPPKGRHLGSMNYLQNCKMPNTNRNQGREKPNANQSVYTAFTRSTKKSSARLNDRKAKRE